MGLTEWLYRPVVSAGGLVCRGRGRPALAGAGSGLPEYDVRPSSSRSSTDCYSGKGGLSKATNSKRVNIG